MGSLSARYPAAKVPASDMGADTLSTVAARSDSRPRLVMTDTMWKISAVLMSECDELAKSSSQKLGVRMASRSEKLTSRKAGAEGVAVVLAGSALAPSGRRPTASGFRYVGRPPGLSRLPATTAPWRAL